MEDREIVALLLARDETGLTAAQEKYRGAVERLAGRILRDGRDAEECVNDTFFKLWNAVPPHEPESLGAFLHVIARQSAVDRYRHLTAEKRQGTEYALSLEELGECVGGEVGDDTGLNEVIGAWLKTVSPEVRAAFVRRYFAAEPVKEIAGALGWGESKVKSILFRARRGLRDYLKKEGYEP